MEFARDIAEIYRKRFCCGKVDRQLFLRWMNIVSYSNMWNGDAVLFCRMEAFVP